MKISNIAVTFGLILLFLPVVVIAGDLEEGISAFDRQDYGEAFRLLKPLADKNIFEAYYYVGRMYFEGKVVNKDTSKAREWFQKGAEFNESKCQNGLGYLYGNGLGVPQDFQKAYLWYRKAAEQGYAKAQHNLGLMYVKGDSVPQDYARALKWFFKAAEQGYADAQFFLGLIYDQGEGAPQDFAEALKWYTKAAEQGHAEAQRWLGRMHAVGAGVTQNYAEAFKWFRKSAEQGNALAQYGIGLMYYEGQGVSKDRNEAVKWYRQAADQGVAEAQHALETLYAKADDIPQDDTEQVVQDSRKHENLPERVLLPEVPFISWSEAAKLEYTDKNILNPSFAASMGMILKYWEQPLSLLHDAGGIDGFGDDWIVEQKNGDLTELKSIIAKGIPVQVSLSLTPIAHPLSPTFVSLSAISGDKFESKGPGSGALGPIITPKEFDKLYTSLKMKSGVGDTLATHESVISAVRVAIGYDDSRKVIFLHDPTFGPAFEVSYKDFEKMWAASNNYFILQHPADYEEKLSRQTVKSGYRPHTPNEKAAYCFIYGYTLARLEQPGKAVKMLKKGLKVPDIDPGYEHMLWFELARVYGWDGKISQAHSAVNKSIEALPENFRPWRYQAALYNYEGRNAKAEEAERKAAELESNSEALQKVSDVLPRDFLILYLLKTRGWG
jgi:TPR repeat protein